MIWEEAQFIVERRNGEQATAALLSQMAFSALPNMAVKAEGTKKAARSFRDLLGRMFGN